MADLYADNATLRDVSVPSEKVNVNQDQGRLRVKHDSITLSAELAAADVIKMMKLPAGCKLYGARLDHGSIDSTVDVGWEAGASGDEAADPNGILSAVAMTSAGISKMEDTQGLAGQDKQFSEEVQVSITVADLSTTGTGKTIKLTVYYSLD
jgi:hypothetical protein